ncbi:MAG: hypothetical protein ACLR6J_04930 [Parabacteroides merdae]
MKIYEISEATGFSSQSYFWSAFIKQFGMGPSNYAKENKWKKVCLNKIQLTNRNNSGPNHTM